MEYIMPPSHRLELVNESPLAGQMAVYLEDPEAGDCLPLVWQSRDCGPGRSVRLEWNEDFGLTFGPAAGPGLVFSGGEICPAEPGAFLLGRSGAGLGFRPAASCGDSEYVPEEIAAGFVLSLKPGEKRRSLAEMVQDRPAPLVPPAPPGRFQVVAEAGLASVAVALCLDGRPALLGPAEPGRTVDFPARPRYGLVFGSFEAGLVLDLNQVVLTTVVDFTGGSLRAVFRRDCLWEVTPGG
jgi:hypothetical protein